MSNEETQTIFGEKHRLEGESEKMMSACVVSNDKQVCWSRQSFYGKCRVLGVFGEWNVVDGLNVGTLSLVCCPSPHCCRCC